MIIPVVGADGVRQTVNAYLTPAQTTWSVRSALNVAALNCLDPKYAQILPNYTSFLNANARKLSAVNQTVENEFKSNYGASYRRDRDTYMTRVYNYYSSPPARDNFCDAALLVSAEALAVPSAELDIFAQGALTRIEAAFEIFYSAFEQYQIDVAAWDAAYAPPPPQQYYVDPVQTPTAFGSTLVPSPTPTALETAVVPPSTPVSDIPATTSEPVVQSIPADDEVTAGPTP